MPLEGQCQRQDGQEGGQGCEEGGDLGGLAGGHHVSRQVLEYTLQLTGTGGCVVLAAGQVRDLAQGDFIDLPAESTTAALPKPKAKPSALYDGVLLELSAAVHEGVTVVGAETDRIHTD